MSGQSYCRAAARPALRTKWGGRTHLGKALLVESKRRGWFCITERGQELLGDPPERITVAYLMRYPEYVAFRNNGRAGEPSASGLDIEDQAQDQEPVAPETPAKTNAPEQQQGLTALEAAYEVLKEAGEPLNVSELSRRMLSRGLWSTKGATPGQTVASSIAMDIQANGSSSRFRRVSRGLFTLNTPPAPQISPPEAAPRSSPTQPVTGTVVEPLSFADAAEHVLKRFGQRRPMHYKEITRRALELGLIATDGQTPASSMYAVILTEIDRALKRGEQPRFVKQGRGMVTLAAWEPVGLPAEIEQHNRRVRQHLHERLHTLGPAEFESLIGRLLTAIGFENVAVTAASGDGGIDVRGTLVVGDVIRTRMAVQVKRWRRNVQAPIVQQVRGSLGAHEQGLIITTSDFSAGARSEAARPDAVPVALMHGEQLVTLLIEHDIGVRRASYDLIELGEDEE